MVAQNFDRCLKLVLVSEGGNDDDPDDPGGRTSRGIIQREYNAYCDLHKLPRGDVWHASDQVIDAIYFENYWEPLCDAMPAGVDYLYFDMAVNQGPREAAILLQRGLGVIDDGHVGVVTRAAIAKADPRKLVNDVSDRRVAFYRSLRTFWKYGRGWLRRVAEVRADALKMAGTEAAQP